MATGTLTPTPYQTILDDNGNPVSGAKIYTYVAGTTTLVATYTDVGLTVANANPIVADSAGRFVAYLTPGGSYKFVIQTSAGASIRTQDNISAVPASSSNLDVTGTAGETLTAGLVVYLSDGSGSKTAGSWFIADPAQTYSSTYPPEVGMTTAAIASGATGTIRQAGQVTGLSSLTVGSDYFITTAGALTVTPPTNARLMGRADTTSSIIISPNPPVRVNVGIVQGRLTLTSGTPITITDVTGAATVYFTPYGGNQIALYTTTVGWQMTTFVETSLALGTLTNDLPYDVFGYSNSGTLALEALAWTSKTVRATALTTQDGVYVKTGAVTRRYLGTFHTTATTTTEDSLVKRLLWNYYNRVKRPMLRQDATSTWNYSTAAYQQANAAAGNQLAVVIGVAEVELMVEVNGLFSTAQSDAYAGVSIGEDSTSAASASAFGGFAQESSTTNELMPVRAELRKYPAVGYHFYAWLEYGFGSGTQAWNGFLPGTSVYKRCGINGSIHG